MHEAGEIENRLRKHVLSLMEPCIKRQSTFDSRLKEVKAYVDQQTQTLENLQVLLEGAQTLRGTVEGFRAELADWDNERHGHEQAISNRVSHQEVELTALRQTVEREIGNLASQGRTIKGLTEQVTQAHQEISSVRGYCSDRLDVGRDKLSKLRDEFETRQMTSENDLRRLQDTATTTERIIGEMKAELERVSCGVSGMIDKVNEMSDSKASVASVTVQQHEFEVFAQALNAQVAGLRQQFEGLVNDVMAHFQTAAQVVGKSTAKQMDDMRSKYGEDAEKVHEALREMVGFVDAQKSAQLALRGDLSDARDHAAAQLSELSEHFEAQGRQTEQEAKELSVEVAHLRKRIQELEAMSQGGENGGNALRSDVLSMMVESEILSAMLDLQDDQDRRSIALVGFKGTESKPPHEAAKGWTLPDLDGAARRGTSAGPLAAAATDITRAPRSAAADATRTPRRRAVASAPSDASPVMTIDKRCLSCSGSAATVLAGFKMACLQYVPSPVVYRQVSRSRSEMIRLRMDLLNQAKEQLRSID